MSLRTPDPLSTFRGRGLGTRLSQEWTNMIHLPQMKTADTAHGNFCKCDQAWVSQAGPEGRGYSYGHDVCGVSTRVVYNQALQVLFTYPTGNTPLKGSH